MFIKLENISFTYLPGTPLAVTALEDIDLEIERGESIGIVGRTGCGKSTLIQHFNALLIPQSGRVLVDGVDTGKKGAPLQEIRRKVGLVFQYPEDQFFEETVFKEVAFAPRNLGVEGKELEDKVKWSLEAVGLDFEAVKDKSPLALGADETSSHCQYPLYGAEAGWMSPPLAWTPEERELYSVNWKKLQKEREV